MVKNIYLEMREKWKLTQRQAATLAGVGERAWATAEGGKTTGAATLKAINRVLTKLVAATPNDNSKIDRDVDEVRTRHPPDAAREAIGFRLHELQGVSRNQTVYADALADIEPPPGIPKVRIDQTMLSRYHHGHVLPSVSALYIIATEANVSMEWILTGRGKR
jgi:DNA-binding XRE family transcriptional regulator